MRLSVVSAVVVLFLAAIISAQGTPRPAAPPIAFGTNVGHWLSQAKLDRAEMKAFFTEADVARIKAWGMDHIRVPVDSPLIASDTDRDRFSEEGLSWIDRAVTWTRTAGLTLVLDMHHLPGHGFMSEGTNTIWTDGPDRRQALALWKTLAVRYTGQPHVVFELMNEPVAPAGRDELWYALARELVAVIRSVNQENWIMIGSNRWSNASTFATLPRFDDVRVIYTFHLYDPFLFTHQRASWVADDIKNLEGPVPYPGPLARTLLNTDWLVAEHGWMADRSYGSAFLRERLATVLRFRDTHRVPVYCGEFGVLATAPAPDRQQWYRDVVGIFRAESIGFANWNYKSDNFGIVNHKGVADPALVEALGAAGAAEPRGHLMTFDESGDVGQVSQPGSITAAAAGTFDVSGSGANIWGSSDQFYFASKRVTGDLEIVADVEFIDTPPAGGAAPGVPDPHRKAGLMVRASREPDAPYADVMVHGDGHISLQYRTSAGGPTVGVPSPVPAPAALRFERQGNVFSLEVQPRGGQFQPVAAIVLPLPDAVLAGLAVSAHSAARTERARFRGVSFVTRSPVPEAQRVIESTLETLDVATGRRAIAYRAREHVEAPNWSREGERFLVNRGGLLYTIPVTGGRPVKVDTGTVNGCNNDHGYSPDGQSIALSCGPPGESRVHVVPAVGGQPRLLTESTPSYWHGWSPDGRTLAFVGRRDGEFDIYTVPVDGGPELRLTTARGLDDGPDYTADGQWIYFNSDRTGAMRIWRMRPDGSDQQQVTDDAQYGDWFPHPSPDGRWLVFLSFDPTVQGHPANKDVALRLMPLDGSAPARVIARLFGGQGTLNVPSWSPDSTRVAFVSYRLVAP